MKFEKKDLCNLDYCYAVSLITVDNEDYYIFATDDVGPCYAINTKTYEKETIWEKPGGTMSIVPLEDTNGEFLATINFFPGFEALETEIVHVSRKNGKWNVVPWMKLPYLHRFDIVKKGEEQYLFCGILSSTTKTKADWNYPGSVKVAKLDKNYAPPAKLETIKEGLPINHGYFKVERNGFEQAYIGCDNGVYEFTPPSTGQSVWDIKKLIECQSSDVALCDIDGDGIEEIATIEPFHGNQFVIYKKIEGVYKEVYRHTKKLGFIHALWGGEILEVPAFFCGARSEEKDFFMITFENNSFKVTEIEKGFGPSNLMVLDGNEKATLLVANREANTGTIFFVTKGD